MKRTIILSTIVAGVIAVSYIGVGFAQSGNQYLPHDPNMYMQMCPHCMMRGGMGMMMNQGTMDKMMNSMGMTMPMQRSYRMMMTAQISPDAPSAILAIKNDLGLTQEQVVKIQDVLKRARQDTMVILSEQQKDLLSQMKDMPANMMQMYGYMCQNMDRGPQKSSVDPNKQGRPGTTRVCPWMESGCCW